MVITSGAKVRLYIKYMVSLRCKLIVKAELEKVGIKHGVIDLGVVELQEEITEEQREKLQVNLKKWGLELLDDKKKILIERIQNVVVEMVHYSDELIEVNASDFISEKLGYDYTYLSNMFAEIKGMTLQHYIIIHKIEKVKELLLYDELSLTEISYRLRYSSVSHLSYQFKKITGVTPTFYKKLKHKRNQNLEDL